MNKRVLLLPNDLGGGRGHVSRMLYLARLIQHGGAEAAIVLGGKYAHAAQKERVRVLPLEYRRKYILEWRWKAPRIAYHRMVSHIPATPVFIHFSGLDYQVPRDGYLNDKIVHYRLKQLEKICVRFKPGLIIGDTHLLALLLSKRCSVPVIQVTRKAGFPPEPEFLWWQEQPFTGIKPAGVQPFIEQAAKTDLQIPKRAEDLLAGTAYIIPSVPEIEPVSETGVPVIYSGAFHAPVKRNAEIRFPGDDSTPAIYITIGGGTSRGQLRDFFKILVRTFQNRPFRILVSTAGKIPAEEWNGLAENIRFENWVNGPAAIAQSDLIIHHGGYSSTMETILSGKPALVIPAHSEQEGNGRRLEQLGVGKVLLPYSEPLEPLRFSWTYGDYSVLAAYEVTLDPEKIRSSVQDLLESSAVEKVKRLQQTVQEKQNAFHPEYLWNLIK